MSETEFKVGGRQNRPVTRDDIVFFGLTDSLRPQLPVERIVSVGAGVTELAQRSNTTEGVYISLNPHTRSEVEKLSLPACPFAD